MLAVANNKEFQWVFAEFITETMFMLVPSATALSNPFVQKHQHEIDRGKDVPVTPESNMTLLLLTEPSRL
jgi:hypothetical protein